MNPKKLQIFSFIKRLTLGLAIIGIAATIQIVTQGTQVASAHHATDCSDVYTPLSSFVTDGVNRNKSFYIQVMNETGVPWEMLAAIHYRETNFSHTNPSNGQGVFQFVNGDGGPYPAGAVSDAEFIRQLKFMANKLQGDYVNRGSAPRERRQLVANEQNVAIVKDTLFSYNGRAAVYTNQAGHFGYNPTTQPYEGSPYVMNRFDCPRARMGIVTRDYGAGIDGADARYGAFTVFARLRGEGYRNSLLQPYSTQLKSASVFVDEARTQRFSTARPTVTPSGKAYARVEVVNTGYQAWSKSVVRLGTNKPRDSRSALFDSSWLSTGRAAAFNEASVPPGGIATFDFRITNPNTGSYTGHLGVVADGIQWLNDINIAVPLDVISPVAPERSGTVLSSGKQIKPGETVLSPDGQSALTLQKDGNIVLRTNFIATWTSNTSGSNPKYLTMQPDGNLVLYSNNSTAAWNSGTSGAGPSSLELQTDGNLVLYNGSSAAIWSTGTSHYPNLLSYVNQSLHVGVMYPMQSLSTANRVDRLILQPDGNLVLRSNNRAVWSSGSMGRQPAYMIMQPDGNLVVVGVQGDAIWNSRTSGSSNKYLQLQQDGNLVIYDNQASAVWYTSTFR